MLSESESLGSDLVLDDLQMKVFFFKLVSYNKLNNFFVALPHVSLDGLHWADLLMPLFTIVLLATSMVDLLI